uniref:Cystatin domain-containing protein n=1 Tax=Strongyloides stercoralis TaxID=6248 RepID=A0A0K0DZ75_STRER
MNSKLTGLLFLIAAFFIACSFGKPSKCSKSSKWSPVKYTKSDFIYTIAETAAKHFYHLALKDDPENAEVCKVLRVSRKNKKYKVVLVANKKRCTKEAGNVCWHIIEAKIHRRNKQIYTVLGVKEVKDKSYGYPSCHFPELK